MEISKRYFLTFIERMRAADLIHAVGLLTFGKSVNILQPLTRDFDQLEVYFLT